MLGYGDQAGIQHLSLSVGRFIAQHQKPEIIGETDLSDQVTAQIVTANRDRVRIRRGDCGEGLILFPMRIPFPFFAYRKYFLLPKTLH
jgi:hypothetical protein